MVLVDYPRFERLPSDRGAIVGNEAVVGATGGLVALLESTVCDARVLGSGYQAPLTVPFGLTVTAALGALGEADPLQDRWMVRRAVIEWQSRARSDEAIIANARVERAADSDVLVAAAARGSASGPLLTASVRLVAMRGGRYAALAEIDLPRATAFSGSTIPHSKPSPKPADVDERASAANPLLRMHPPQLSRSVDRVESVFEPDLLRLLMHPVSGHTEPLGRRIHPLGGAPLGAALTTAFAAAGENDPDRPLRTHVGRVDATWLSPLSPHDPWRARTRDGTSFKEHAAVVDVVGADGRVAFTCRVEWRHADAQPPR